MSVLSSEILKLRLLDPNDDFKITPIFDSEKQISSSSVDLRLDNQFIIITRTTFSSINPIQRKSIELKISQYQKKITVPFGEKFVLHPNELVIGSTIEYLSFPKDLMSYVIGRSSWGRLGLVIATATAINPCFKGNLTLELVNLGNVPIELYPGVRIAQLVIHYVSKPELGYTGKYQIQIGPGFSKIYKDEELDYLSLQKYKIIIGITGHKGSGIDYLSSYLIEDRLYRFFSLSHIVRKKFKQDELGEPSRKDLQNFGDRKREENTPDYFAREIIREINHSELNESSNILIGGIRNPNEVDLLNRLPNFHLIGIDAKKEKIKENLRSEGILISDDEYSKKIEGIEQERDKDRKKILENELNSFMNNSQHEEAFKRDCGDRPGDRDKQYGQNIKACLEKVEEKNKIVINKDTTIIEALGELKKIIDLLE